MATYTCDTGYTISGATPITCMSDGTSNGTWSPAPPAACAREYCTDYIAMHHHNRSTKYKMFYSNQALSSELLFAGVTEIEAIHTIHLL